ncbi:hypothetical protein MPEAHAMD_0640 [Methylobacterium frigidaeris]|uniref:Uncharacterized protein n=1 Tax=Methylobacterium frigidaeris TaxID=2038277 RepID=A0AA37M2R1_9HYPH|nr:hypothetical protein MPEAHAMD_0640 [Methylobacterium frigidaeris]
MAGEVVVRSNCHFRFPRRPSRARLIHTLTVRDCGETVHDRCPACSFSPLSPMYVLFSPEPVSSFRRYRAAGDPQP